MSPFLLEPGTARDLLDGLRLLEGRLQGTSRVLTPGTIELRRIAEVSAGASTVQLCAVVADPGDDRLMVTQMLTYDDVAKVLNTSARSVKRLVADGVLPVVHVGSNARVHVDDLQSFIDAARNEAKVD